jgi:hypothetical protein
VGNRNLLISKRLTRDLTVIYKKIPGVIFILGKIKIQKMTGSVSTLPAYITE